MFFRQSEGMEMDEAVKWAERTQQFPGPCMEMFCDVVRLMQPLWLAPESIAGRVQIDEGAFGNIDKGTLTMPEKVCGQCRTRSMKDALT